MRDIAVLISVFVFFLVFFPQSSVKMGPVHAACTLLGLAPLLVLGVPPLWTQPEQVHLSSAGQCLNNLSRSCVFSLRETDLVFFFFCPNFSVMRMKANKHLCF